MKQCPFCTAEVADKAVKCKHCGEWIEATSSIPESGATHTVKVRVEQTEFQKTAFKWVLALMIVSGAVGLLIVLGFFFGVFLPGWNRIEQHQERWERDFDKHMA